MGSHGCMMGNGHCDDNQKSDPGNPAFADRIYHTLLMVKHGFTS